LRIFLYYLGKARDAHANAMAAEYVKRTGRFTACELREVQPARFDPWARHPAAAKVLLDPEGKAIDSRAFARRMERAEAEGRDLVFLVGGADGLPEAWRRDGAERLSLSPLTLPHELARAVLAEQIYRAFATLRGHPYPR
jgi:23S rRNA (pseudouridine1915-N3)-methyltransferase